jgi:hypothetical protein
MPFKKGNKLSKGGTPGNNGGRPTREEAEIKKTLVEKYWAEVEKRLDTLLSKYFREKGIARDVINRAIPYAKQVVDVESIKPHVIDRQAILAIIATPDAHEAVEKMTAAITKQMAGNGKEPDRALSPPMPVAGSDSGGSDKVIHSRVFRIPRETAGTDTDRVKTDVKPNLKFK